MAAATLTMKVVAASIQQNAGASSNTNPGTTTLTLVLEATQSAAAVPKSDTAKKLGPNESLLAKGMVGKALTLNYDSVTGAITSLT